MRSLIALLLLLPSFACANDVLFVDLNNSPKELEAAREAARKSRRNFIVYPDVPANIRQQAVRLGEQAAGLGRRIERQCKAEAQPPACTTMRTQKQAAEAQKTQLLSNHQFHRDGLKALLEAREAAGKGFSTVVVSGHDGTGHFSGDLGGIGDKEFAELLDDYPKIKSSIRALHLWGCYTTSPGSLMLNWKKNFPEVQLITGYDGRAPLNDKPAGWQYLRGVIEREPQLFQISDHRRLKALLRQIPGASTVHAAIFICDEYANHRDSFNFSEMNERCNTYIKQLQDNSEKYACFLKATDPACAEPPANTGSGPVREFYEILHRATACVEMRPEEILRTYNRDQAIRLVFNREVQRNFGRIYAKELAEYDAMLKEFGAPESLRFSNAATLTRGELMKKMEELQQFIKTQQPDPNLDPASLAIGERDAKLHALRGFQYALTSSFSTMGANCVPFNWTEPHKDDASPCFVKENMGNSFVAKLMGQKPLLASIVYGGMANEMDQRLGEFRATADNGALARAREELMLARADLTRQYRDQTDEASAARAMASIRVKWAEKVLALSEAGNANPARDPEVVALTWQYNQLENSRMIGIFDKVIPAHAAKAANAAESEANRAAAQSAHDEAVGNRRIYQLAQEGTTILSAGTEASQERFAEIKKDLGAALLAQQIRNQEAEVASNKAVLENLRNTSPLPTNDIITYATKLSDAERRVAELKADDGKLSEQLAEVKLFRPEFRSYEHADQHLHKRTFFPNPEGRPNPAVPPMGSVSGSGSAFTPGSGMGGMIMPRPGGTGRPGSVDEMGGEGEGEGDTRP